MKHDEPEDEQTTKVRTLMDLARLAGVNAATVSRALSGSAVVNAATKARILDLARQHNFRPNQMARRLRIQRSGMVGLVVPLGHEQRQHLSDPFFSAMIGHLASQITENGYDLMLSRVVPDMTDWLDNVVGSGMLDGLLVLGQSDQFDALEKLATTYRPLVTWGCALPGQRHCAIGTDNLEGGRLAAQCLADGGGSRFAFFGDPCGPEIGLRWEGFRSELARRNLPDPAQMNVALASDVMNEGVDAALDRLGAVDAVFAASDLIALNVIRKLADRGIDVPRRVRIVGYDDLPSAVHSIPRLTTIRQDIGQGAELMAAALLARMRGEDAPSVQLEPKLIRRDTA